MNEVLYTDTNASVVTAVRKDDLNGHRYTFKNPNTLYFTHVDFQNGSVLENGVNGVTNEALLVMLIDRTKILNSKFHSKENDEAIKAMETALAAFEVRNKDRAERGVKGKYVL